MNFEEKLENLKDMYNLYIFTDEVKGVEYMEIATEDVLHKLDLIHINMVLKDEGYHFDVVEAFNDTIAITYFKK